MKKRVVKYQPKRNVMREKLFREIAKGAPIAVAAKKCGYSTGSAAWNAIGRAQKTRPELLVRCGLTKEALERSRESYRRSVRFNPMRTKLLKAMVKEKSMTEAAKEAGYSCVQGASNALRAMKESTPDLMDRLGLTDESLIKKNLLPLLNAKKTIFFQSGGVVMDKREVPALEIRQSALDMAFRLKNKYPQKLEIEHSGVVNHVLTESDKRDAELTLKKLAAYEAEESEDTIEGELVES